MRFMKLVTALWVAALLTSACMGSDVYVDVYGFDGPTSWNNIRMATPDSTLLLRDTSEVYTGVRLRVVQALLANNLGLTNLTGDAAAFIPAGDTACYGQDGDYSTGEILLDGLATNVAYSFTFFGSRKDVTDRRTALYTVSGSTTGSAALDASGNASQVALVPDVLPRADGTLTITVAKATDNNNSSRFFYLSAFKMTFQPSANPVTVPLQTPVYFDVYGNTSRQIGWNNVSFSSSATSPVYDASNRLTSVTFRTTYQSESATSLTLPTLTGEAADFAPAGGSCSFGSKTRSRFNATLSGLDASATYALTFFACHEGVTDIRDAFYTVTGRNTKTCTLNASSNSNRVGKVGGVVPNADGTLDIAVNIGPDNTHTSKYFFLNAFKLEPLPAQTPDANVIFLDAYGDNTAIASGWNNCDFSKLSTYALNDTNATATGIKLQVLAKTGGWNASGAPSPSGLAAEFAPVLNNCTYGFTNTFNAIAPIPVVRARLSNLSTNIPYSFTHSASRMAAGDTFIRETRCKYIGANTGYSLLNVANNSNRVATADGIYPNPDGTLTLELTIGPNQTELSTAFFYISGLKITYPAGGIPFDPLALTPAGKKLLFFGNSYTINNNVTGTIAQIARSAGHPAPLITGDLAGGQDLAYFASRVSAAPSANVSHASIGVTTWDHVIMQGYSTEATAALGDPSAFRTNAVTLFRRVAHHASGKGSGAGAILFQTWARGPESSVYPGTFANASTMQNEIIANYAAACGDICTLEGTFAARVAPVGAAFAAEGFASDLYDDDDSHATVLGSRLASLVLYRTIYDGEPVSGISFASAQASGAASGLTEAEWARLTARADSTAVNGIPTATEASRRETFYIDAAGNDAGSRWNNLSLITAQTATLMTTDGRRPGVTLSVTVPVQSLNANGTNTPSGAAAEFLPAAGNSVYGNVAVFTSGRFPKGVLVLRNLSRERHYAFTFWASRMGVTDSRETRYTITGGESDAVLLDSVNNYSQVVSTGYVAPAADGTITLAYEPGPHNTDSVGFFHLGAFKVESKLLYPTGTLIKLR